MNSCLQEECCLNASLCPLVQSVLHVASTSELCQEVTVTMSRDLHVFEENRPNEKMWNTVTEILKSRQQCSLSLFFFLETHNMTKPPPPRFFWHFYFCVSLLDCFWEVKGGVTDYSWTVKPEWVKLVLTHPVACEAESFCWTGVWKKRDMAESWQLLYQCCTSHKTYCTET